MEELIQLLLNLLRKVPYLSESDFLEEVERLRRIEMALGNGTNRVVPPAAVDQPGPVAPTTVPVPGPVADPVPPDEQPPVPTSPELADAAPEATNAFSGVAPDAAT
jgi:hypothetical protein